MNTKKIIGIIVVITLLILIGFIRYNSAPQNETIKIGMVYSLTGPASVWSENGKNAAMMAAEEINASGGVNGKKIELVFEDSASNPGRSVSAFKKFTEIDGIRIISGDMWSVTTNPLIPLTKQNKILLISPTVMDASVQESSPYFFTLGHTVESQKKSLKKFFSSNPEIKTVYNLCWNDAWGAAHTVLIKKTVKELGLQIIGETCTSDYASDYRTEAAKIKVANPDAIFLTGAFEDIAIKALRDLGVTSKIVTTTGIIEAVKVREFPLEYMKNVWFMNWNPNDTFISNYENKFGSFPIMEAHNHYEVIYSVAKALKNNPEDPITGLKSVKYEGTDGEINFTGSDNIRINKAEAGLYKFNGNRDFVEVR